MSADFSVSKPPASPPPDEGKGRPPSGKRGPAKRRPPAKPAEKTATSATPRSDGTSAEPEHKLDLLV